MTSFLSIVALINGINGYGDKVLSLCLGLGLGAAFLRHEMVATAPLIPRQIFKLAQRRQTYLIRFFYSAAITGFWFFTPRVLQSLYGLSPILVGISFLSMTLVNFISAKQVDRLAHRWGNRRLLLVGLGIALLGFAGLLGIHTAGNFWLTVAVPMILIGYGQGLVLSPVTTLAIDGLDSAVAGIGSSLINVMLQIGGVTGLAVLATLFGQETPVTAYHLEVWGIVGFVGLSLLLAVKLVWNDRKK
ncbi:MAG TPA: MFS transporter [Candidatus Levilactobacillus faecigallinarum]|uniref:MFS transporter n=1 Tax=Candidatus Levilactobacillus faecigallinarum TaxID=2838638 RepID=A0A9D1U5A3_9LACO|nr:MFS transporter [Candidatus Levilactobacillus faecigallinarum]